jgi:hypothetical protein
VSSPAFFRFVFDSLVSLVKAISSAIGEVGSGRTAVADEDGPLRPPCRLLPLELGCLICAGSLARGGIFLVGLLFSFWIRSELVPRILAVLSSSRQCSLASPTTGFSSPTLPSGP